MIETERKFVVKTDLFKIRTNVDPKCRDCMQSIEQGYVVVSKNVEWRIREVMFVSKANKADADSWRTALKIGNGLNRREYETDIPRFVYRVLRRFVPKFIYKTRFDVEGWSVDFFHEDLYPLQLAEYEFHGSERTLPPVPKDVRLLRDVTGQTLFANKNLSRMTFEQARQKGVI